MIIAYGVLILSIIYFIATIYILSQDDFDRLSKKYKQKIVIGFWVSIVFILLSAQCLFE